MISLFLRVIFFFKNSFCIILVGSLKEQKINACLSRIFKCSTSYFYSHKEAGHLWQYTLIRLNFHLILCNTFQSILEYFLLSNHEYIWTGMFSMCYWVCICRHMRMKRPPQLGIVCWGVAVSSFLKTRYFHGKVKELLELFEETSITKTILS